jgi:hypothetical protein
LSNEKLVVMMASLSYLLDTVQVGVGAALLVLLVLRCCAGVAAGSGLHGPV